LLESAPMRFRTLLVRSVVTAAAAGLALVSTAVVASAQVIVSPNAEPTKNDGGWVYWLAIVLAALGVLAVLLIVFAYMRYAPRFQREEGARRGVKAPRIQPGKEAPRRAVNVTGPPAVVPAPAAAAPAPAAAAPAPAAAAPAPAAAAPAPAAAAPAPAAPPAEAAEHKEVSLDQETFDRVLAELLEKGTTRRVAEGQARRAAMIAARKKAAG
jgi:pyruvate/2-oxoglutarate dehydrogenase complex dihydrolipoamide acyltransferase (E2) component